MVVREKGVVRSYVHRSRLSKIMLSFMAVLQKKIKDFLKFLSWYLFVSLFLFHKVRYLNWYLNPKAHPRNKENLTRIHFPLLPQPLPQLCCHPLPSPPLSPFLIQMLDQAVSTSTLHCFFPKNKQKKKKNLTSFRSLVSLSSSSWANCRSHHCT